jgi:uncharacterized protein (TIGR03382 family)
MGFVMYAKRSYLLPCVMALACEVAGPPGPAAVTSPIIGGTSDSGHPAVGAVLMNNSMCTGTLISPKVVVTAAHCMEQSTPQEFVFGSSINSGTLVPIQYYEQHPQYTTNSYGISQHDIAVAVLLTKSSVTPMAYRTATMNGTAGQSITFVGFGENHTGYKYKVTTTVGSVESQGFWNYANSSNPKNTCVGDSGGPGIVVADGVEQVAGIVSAGDENCNKDGWNTRVDVNASWLAQMIAKYDPTATGPVCGNGKCEAGETTSSCAKDCKPAPVCGNGVCETGEKSTTCPADCTPKPYCGDGKCNGTETYDTCDMDCPPPAGPVCGNGTCEDGETADNCAGDCPVEPWCGDGACNGGEATDTCPGDCPPAGPVCGNGACEEGEDAASCPTDCQDPQPACGDGTCGEGEGCESCSADCGPCQVPAGGGDGTTGCAASPRAGTGSFLPVLLALVAIRRTVRSRMSEV